MSGNKFNPSTRFTRSGLMVSGVEPSKVKNTFKKLRFLVIFIFLFFALYAIRYTLYAIYALDAFVYDAKGKRDPFIPLLTSDGRLLKLDIEESTSDLTIQGILFDADGLSYAVVNGTTVGVGDEIKGYRVLKVEKDKVVFIKEGQISEIEYKKEGT